MDCEFQGPCVELMGVTFKRDYALGVPWWLSGLRIPHYHCYGIGLIIGLGTSACHGHSQKKKKKKKRQKKDYTLEDGLLGKGTPTGCLWGLWKYPTKGKTELRTGLGSLFSKGPGSTYLNLWIIHLCCHYSALSLLQGGNHRLYVMGMVVFQ